MVFKKGFQLVMGIPAGWIFFHGTSPRKMDDEGNTLFKKISMWFVYWDMKNMANHGKAWETMWKMSGNYRASLGFGKNLQETMFLPLQEGFSVNCRGERNRFSFEDELIPSKRLT